MPRLPVLAALVTVTLWASAFVGIRSAGEDLSAGALSLGRLLVATVVLAAIMHLRREPLPRRADLPALVLCGLFWFAIYNVALNAAEQSVDAGTAAMLVNVGPILIALLAGFVLKEGFPRTLLAGCAVAFAGSALIGFASSEQGVDAGWGAVLCLVAALAYAIGVVAQKPVLEHTSPVAVTFVACAVGATACLPFAPVLAQEARARAPRPSAGRCIWASSPPRWPSPPGPTRSPTPAPAGWGPPPIWFRRWRSSWVGSSSARPHPRSRSRVVRSASPEW